MGVVIRNIRRFAVRRPKTKIVMDGLVSCQNLTKPAPAVCRAARHRFITKPPHRPSCECGQDDNPKMAMMTHPKACHHLNFSTENQCNKKCHHARAGGKPLPDDLHAIFFQVLFEFAVGFLPARK
nr:hypothetical protein LVJ77_05390 [Conchiformibius kuhniae]